MKNKSLNIRKIVTYLNNPEEDGGFWLPNIQRPFVWDEDQICRLFDSILREYPISTLLVWKTTSNIRRRKFIDNYSSKASHIFAYIPEDDRRKCLVLDGQQRLQSLYIALKGSYDGREMYFDVTSSEASLPDDIRFKFKFMETSSASFPWVKFKDLVFTERRKREILSKIEDILGRRFSTNEADQIGDNLDLVDRTFKTEEAVTYQELDSIENASLYTEDDVVEIFIRANSGGTKLQKSDLLFSLLASSWDRGEDRMSELLADVNGHGFAFDRDFVLKTCLVLLDKGAKYEVAKFREPGIREEIEAKWETLAGSIRAMADYLRSKTYIRCDKALPSYLALIPLIYIRHHFPNSWKEAKGVPEFLARTLLAGAFSGQSDRLLDALVKRFREIGRFDAEEAYEVIRGQNRNLSITRDRLFEMGYGSRNIHLLFNLWYPSFTYTPAYENNLPQVDHVFAQSRLRTMKMDGPTGRPVMRHQDAARNQLANCMLLTMNENGGGGKSDATVEEWLKDKGDDYLDLHLIPKDRSLWALENYEEFIAARKQLIEEKFTWLLV